jgi:predicted NBD/HSP70 family sugar kinase
MVMRKIHGGSLQALRESNKRLLLERLLAAGDGLTRPELARSLGLTVPAITNLVSGGGESLATVLDESPARAHSHRAANSGPIPKVVTLKPRLGYVVGIALSHTRIQVALADLFGEFDPKKDRRTTAWDVENDLHGALAYAAGAVHELTSARGARAEQIAAIGLAIAAPVNVSGGPHPTERRGRLRGHLGNGSPLPWLNIDPVAALTNHLAALADGQRWSSIELHVDNEANLGALAELRSGAGRGKQNIIYIQVEAAGIGGGLVFNGLNYRGAGGIAGEFGHLVIDPDRPEQCRRCGRACVETIVLTKLGCRNAGSSDRPLDQIVRAALDNDTNAIAAITDAAGYLGRALAPFITLLNFDGVLIGGPFPAQAYSLVVPPIQAALDGLTNMPEARDYVVELGALHRDASLKGAIWLALDRTRVDYLLRRAAQPEPAAPDSAATVSGLVATDA